MKLSSTLPASLSRALGASAVLTRSGFNYDYAIGGLGFLSAASDEQRYERETAPFRKQQIDQSSEPGEQSLDGWWYRSQATYVGGAGQVFGDPKVDGDVSATRFFTSRGVDVWTDGEAKLLNRIDTSGSVAGVHDIVPIAPADGVDAAFGISELNYYTWRETARTDYGWAASPLQSLTTDGSNLFVAAADGVWKSAIPATWNGTFSWSKIWDTGVDPIEIGWVKQRLVMGVGPKVYELAGTGPALPAPLYTHPNPAWRWTDSAESGSAIYMAGYAGTNSAIIKFTLSSGGSMPTLSSGVVAAQLPAGEVVHSLYGYLGTFVAIGTNRGVRVALSDAEGNLEYGPLIFESDGPVRGFTARDRFLWATVSRGVDGGSGLYRIDLGNEVEQQQFAYATDLAPTVSDTADCLAVSHLGSSDAIVFATAGADYRERSAVKVASGYLQTSAVRYSTLEPKMFQAVRVRGSTLAGSLGVSIVDSSGSVLPLLTFGAGTAPGGSDLPILSLSGPAEYVSLRFTLNAAAGVDPVTGAAFRSWQLKALPAAPAQRLITVPLLCFEQERDGRKLLRHDVWARIRALEALESARTPILFQDYSCNESPLVMIEQVRFVQSSPPTDSRCKGYGGILSVTVRTVI